MQFTIGLCTLFWSKIANNSHFEISIYLENSCTDPYFLFAIIVYNRLILDLRNVQVISTVSSYMTQTPKLKHCYCKTKLACIECRPTNRKTTTTKWRVGIYDLTDIM